MFMIKKPKPVECRQWDGNNLEEMKEFSNGFATSTLKSLAPDKAEHLLVKTPHGDAVCEVGDYLFKGGDGDFYPVKASFVVENYDLNEEGIAQGPCIPATGFDIGQAIVHMRNGCKVRRAGWNGKGMFIVLMPELKLPPFNSQAPGAKVNDRTAKHIGPDTPLDSQPYIAMWTAAKQWQPGWLCSQADLLANDWELAD